MVAEFQHGLVRLDVVLVALALIAAGPRRSRRSGCASASPVRRRVVRVGRRSARSPPSAIVACSARATRAGTCRRTARTRSRDADEAALGAHPRRRCAIEVHLAPEDPRRVDLERRALVEAAARDAAAARCTTSRRPRSASSSRRARTTARSGTSSAAAATMSRVDDGRGRARDDLRRWPASRRPPETTSDSSAAIRSRCRRAGAAAVFYGVWPALVVAGAVLHSQETVHDRDAASRTDRRWRRCVARRAAAARPTSRSISARNASASRRRPSSRWSARGSSRRTAPTR